MKKIYFRVFKLSILVCLILMIVPNATIEVPVQVSAETNLAKADIAVFGSDISNSTYFNYDYLTFDESTKQKVEKHDALFITADFFRNADTEKLRAFLKNLDLPIVFIGFADKGTAAFMNSTVSKSEMYLEGALDTQMLYYFNENEYAGFAAPDFKKESQKRLNNAIQLANEADSLPEWNELETMIWSEE
ncbi:hypothetical protein HB943_04230 [Listeria weihenstephanensis]|uniref:Uncharacterized protein n=1 Tax=Listeria weihenstephanensis TaxID=1006155 RepID=A0A841Z1S8_9LIST|nr:hypothetical protein [Listeria weihenstephanensis]MBC1499801.1 hypothetical protein [Listeria weihenstephanensis]